MLPVDFLCGSGLLLVGYVSAILSSMRNAADCKAVWHALQELTCIVDMDGNTHCGVMLHLRSLQDCLQLGVSCSICTLLTGFCGFVVVTL